MTLINAHFPIAIFFWRLNVTVAVSSGHHLTLRFPFTYAVIFRCRIVRLPNFLLPIFLVAVFPWSFPFSLFQTILCCPFFLPCQFSLPNFPIAQFSGSHFFRCRFFSCLFSVAVFAVNRWCGYLSGARCRLFAYGPADANAIPKPHHLLPPSKSRLVWPFWYRLTQVVLEEAVKRV